VRLITRLLALVTLTGLSPALATAHPAPFSYLDVRLQPNRLDVTVVVHVFDIAHELGITPIDRVLDSQILDAYRGAITKLLNDRLQLGIDATTLGAAEWSPPDPLPERQSLRLRTSYQLPSAPGAVVINTVMFPYDPVHQTFINVYEGDQLVKQAILDKGRTRFEHFTGTRQGTLAIVQKFIGAGVHHILIGPDHMLFLVGLLLLGGSLRRLIMVVSAFTLAHSVTLSLAALNIFNPPGRIVEPAIALSIVFIGVDNLIVHGGRDVRAWIAFTFGFVHGFGFASVLREMGLDTRALGWSLFAFNLGVEIGQLFVVVGVASLLAFLRMKSETAGRRLAFAGSLVVIAAGTFWFIERVFFPGGMA
jgi:hydrogenase/urease accessory protein HupE